MQTTDDLELLREYAAKKSEAAFAALVSRYINVVYSAALRQVGDPHLAEEVTQAVFIILARKAGGMGEGTLLLGWLVRTVRFTASAQIRTATRRRRHEQEAQMDSSMVETSPASSWEHISPLLDEALADLNAKDRQAVLLRYMDGKSLAEVGASLAVNEEAARKRVTRALEKLRQFFTKRGVVFTAVVIGGAMSANAVRAAPAGLAKTVAGTAITHTVAGGSTITLVKGALKLMAWTKLKMAAVIGVAALLTASATVTIVKIMTPPDYSWEVANPSTKDFSNARPQLTILPTKFDEKVGWRVISAPDGECMGIKMNPMQIIQWAYKAQDLPIQTNVDGAIPGGEYDFICNFPNGASDALRKAIRTKFGLTGRLEKVATNILVLSVINPKSVGLKKDNNKRGQNRPGHISMSGYPIANFAQMINGYFHIPVVDHTGLIGNYSIDIKWDAPPQKARGIVARGPAPDEPSPPLEPFNQALMEQLGLQLTPDIQPVDKLLVIERVKK